MKTSAAYSKELERVSRLQNPLQRSQELLDLLKLSSNYDTNYVLASTKILAALAEIVVVECLAWGHDRDAVLRYDDDKDDDERGNLLLQSKRAWERPPTKRLARWLDHCACYEGLHDDSIRVLEAIAMIMRNFSFTGANVRVMAYCPSVLYSLVAFLAISAKNPIYRRRCQRRQQHQQQQRQQQQLQPTPRRGGGVAAKTGGTSGMTPTGSGSGGGGSSNSGAAGGGGNIDFESLSTSALQTLLYCVRYLDVTGQQLVADKLFNDMNLQDDSFGQCASGRMWGDSLGACWFARRLKDDTMEENIPTAMVLDLAADVLTGVWSIFPALAQTFLAGSRPVTLLTLELLAEWIGLARVGLVGAVMPEDDSIRPGDNYSIPGIRAVLAQVPDSVLKRLVELLSVPKLGGDGLE
jgi:hypothetical protein